jgi:Reverse transcriptase (RNA-dependent DNA polymerase)/Cobalamin-independent synthase, N-terminal domain
MIQLGCPASFEQLMEQVSTMGIQNVLIYIDDTLVHTDTHEKHLQVLEQVFTKLQKNHLKINLDKCFFGDDQVSYLEFTKTPSGIKPGEEKLIAIKNAATPSDIKSIQSFIRLRNFFRNHIQNFAITAAPLFKLTAKIQDTLWRHYQHQHCVPSRH